MTQGIVLRQWRTVPCTHKFLSRFLTLLAPRQPGPEGGLPCPCHRLFGHSVSDGAACCPARNGDLDDHASRRDLAFWKLKMCHLPATLEPWPIQARSGSVDFTGGARSGSRHHRGGPLRGGPRCGHPVAPSASAGRSRGPPWPGCGTG